MKKMQKFKLVFNLKEMKWVVSTHKQVELISGKILIQEWIIKQEIRLKLEMIKNKVYHQMFSLIPILHFNLKGIMILKIKKKIDRILVYNGN